MKQGLNIQIGLLGRRFSRNVNSIQLWVLLLSALPVMTACDDDSEKEKGVKIELSWDDVKPEFPPDFVGSGDNDSAEVEIKEISVWLHPADGSPAMEYTFSDRQDLSEQQFELPVGEYRIFSTVNLLPPYIDEYNPMRSRAFTDGKEHFITLEKPNLSPEPAYCYEDRIVITESGVQTVKVKMKELLAEMTFSIKGVPNGTILKGSVGNATAGIIPKFDETLGEMIAERSELIVPVELPVTLSTDGIVTIKKFRLLPSVKGATESLIKMMLLYPNTKRNDFEIHAPEMRMGGKYYIVLDFADMTPYMHLTSIRIDKWTEGWTINGEILNPEEEK